MGYEARASSATARRLEEQLSALQRSYDHMKKLSQEGWERARQMETRAIGAERIIVKLEESISLVIAQRNEAENRPLYLIIWRRLRARIGR